MAFDERGVIITVSTSVQAALLDHNMILQPGLRMALTANNITAGGVDLLLVGQGLPKCCETYDETLALGSAYGHAGWEVNVVKDIGPVLTVLFRVVGEKVVEDLGALD